MTYHGFVRVATAVPAIKVADCAYNAGRIIALMKEAEERQVSVLVFPELCLTGYTCADLFHQSVLQQAAANALAEVARASASGYTGLAVVGLPLDARLAVTPVPSSQAILLKADGTSVTAAVAGWLQPSAHGLPVASELMALAAVAVAGAVISMLARAARLTSAEQAGALVKRAIAEQRKSAGAVFQRQRNPDAAGRARPRAPSAAPAAA